MSFYREIISSLFAFGLLVAMACAADKSWTTDYDAALQLAKKEKKMVLLDFTGSDWCGFCIALNKEVFSKPEFLQYAEKNLVLVEIDFPQSKHQTEAEIKRNDALATKYKVGGYPTIFILNSEGKVLGELGYMEGGPKAFIRELEKLKK